MADKTLSLAAAITLALTGAALAQTPAPGGAATAPGAASRAGTMPDRPASTGTTVDRGSPAAANAKSTDGETGNGAARGTAR